MLLSAGSLTVRSAIENSYSSIKETAAWTTSKEFEARWFHFAFGCVIYNM